MSSSSAASSREAPASGRGANDNLSLSEYLALTGKDIMDHSFDIFMQTLEKTRRCEIKVDVDFYFDGKDTIILRELKDAYVISKCLIQCQGAEGEAKQQYLKRIEELKNGFLDTFVLAYPYCAVAFCEPVTRYYRPLRF